MRNCTRIRLCADGSEPRTNAIATSYLSAALPQRERLRFLYRFRERRRRHEAYLKPSHVCHRGRVRSAARTDVRAARPRNHGSNIVHPRSERPAARRTDRGARRVPAASESSAGSVTLPMLLEKNLHLSNEVGTAERLGDVVVRPEREAVLDVVLGRLRGQEDHGSAARTGLAFRTGKPRSRRRLAS